MISSLDSGSQAFLNGLNLIQRRSLRAQTELTTGLKINSISDQPSQIPELLATQSELNRAQQITSNLDSVKAEVDTGENSLQGAIKIIEEAQTLGIQGQTGFITAEGRQQIAVQLGGILQQLVNTANTSVNGRYIFSGDSDQTAPYSIDLTKANPVSAYAGSPATRQVEHPDGSTFAVAKTAQEIFDSSSPAENVFQVINTLRTALINNDQAAIDAQIPNLKTAVTYVNQQLASYGLAQTRVADGQNFGANLMTQLKTRLSGIEDADMTQAITEFQQASTAQQAALASRAKLPRSSLFDFLG